MFGSILVPLDGSPEAEGAIPYAVDEARRHGCPVVLIRVVARPEAAPAGVAHGGPSRQPFVLTTHDDAAAGQAAAYLREVVRRHGLDPTTETATPIGDLTSRIAAEAVRRPAPLVVLAAPKNGPRARPLVEAARRLLASGTVPVLQVAGSGVMSSPPPDWPAMEPMAGLGSAL